jgi:tetratricopeptide (TPR) repeat protein
MSDRLDALKAMLAEDPKNSFVRYGLAMEYGRSGELEAAVAEFRALIDADPDYAAAYFHCGQTLERLGRIEEAKDMYERGIAVTTRTGDSHTRSELQGALDLLPL